MILEFEVENFRSIKGKQTFSMIAESSKSKAHNVFEHTLANGEKLRLLKSAVIYGPNASGKSNFVRAFIALKKLVLHSVPIGKFIPSYEPFLFDLKSRYAPTKFLFTFIGPQNYKYQFEIVYNKTEIIKEILYYYPKGQRRNLYKRVADGNEIHHNAKLGQDFNNKSIKVFKNQLVLSKFGHDEPDDILSKVFLFFNVNNFGINKPDIDPISFIDSEIDRIKADKNIFAKLSKLINYADTKIKGLIIKESDENIEVLGSHIVFDEGKEITETSISFKNESKGSNMLISMGLWILKRLEIGGIHIIDEIDTSLHPNLAKALVMLFQSKKANPKNAQLIFTTHETTFLDKDFFRRDQIWLTEKNDYGETELFSLQDFDEVREDTPFDKWYMAGRFGGLPDIKALEQIFDNGTEEETN